jgi:glycosyltransferase involved in cell wall biosynthesis
VEWGHSPTPSLPSIAVLTAIALNRKDNDLMNMNIVVGSSIWSLNGVNIFSANLVRGLLAKGISAHILLTEGKGYDPKPMQLPSDIPVHALPVGCFDSYQVRWSVMHRYLASYAPCIYIPNYDYNHSCISPKLPNNVGIVGIAHSDDPREYDHVKRLGKYWNQIVAVSEVIAQKTKISNPEFSEKLVTIPYGVEIPLQRTHRSFSEKTPLKIIYAGVLNQYQKRVLDIPRIAQQLLALNVPFELTIAGGGIEQENLIAASKSLIQQGIVRFIGLVPNSKIPELHHQHDVFIMTSAYEGLPNALIEAMGSGCVPVVTDIESGIPELIRDNFNGYRVPVGDIQMFAKRLAELQQDSSLRQRLSTNAYNTVDRGTYRIQDMVARYLSVFEQVLDEIEQGTYQRPQGAIPLPTALQGSILKRCLPLLGVRTVGRAMSILR